MIRFKTPLIFGIAVSLLSSSATPGTLTESPLYLQSPVPPNVLFALSVEYPTANTAAYQGTNDYSRSNTYLGLFDAKKCYDYDTTNNWFSPVSVTDVESSSSKYLCTGHWSGNFLNWATMTGLDEFRYAMTGGDRYQDTSSLTVVQRTYQSGQGGTSNFPNKTYSGDDATPYSSTDTLTIVNQGKGTGMTITLSGSGTALCTNPQLAGSFSCTLAMQTGEAGSCSSWTGSGTSTSPYRCSTFGAFGALGTPTSNTVGTKSSASTTSTDTVTCTSPAGTSSSDFSCLLKDTANNTGSCNTWTGTGSSGSPFTCTSFGLFNGVSFSSSSTAAAATYSQSAQVTQAADAVTSCSTYSSSQIGCTLASGRTFTCTVNQGNGNTPGNARICSASSTFSISGTPTASHVSHLNATSATTSGGKYYKPPTSVTYSIPVSTTYYYIPSYSGSDSSTYYYYSTYALNFGGSANFSVRAKVCDTSVGLEDNCVKYGSSSYKPIGEVQRNGEKMRFGLFSYYKANDIDNAVMRSKLKYVAPQKWNASGGYSTNTASEWSSSTGVLVTNPDPTEASNSYGGAVSSSGVINYINKFGTTSQGYKTYDNVGKLYYESLKYLRGLSPTSDFYTGSSTASTPPRNDGFPIITSWDDPVQYWCQKNYIITMGDTHTHCDKRLPGGSSTSYGSSQCTGNSQTSDQGSLSGDSGVNVTNWTNALGTLESRANLATTYFSGTSSYYMSGLAYWAAKDGFRTISGHSVKAKSMIIDVQEYGEQGVNSQYWYAAKYGGVDSFDASGNPLSWSTTISGYTGNWPKALLPAGNPAAMISAVRGALSSIAAQTGSGADVGLSTGDLRTGNGTNLYSATYNSSGWSGDVMAYRMSNNLSISSTPIWQASTYLNPTTLNPTSGTKPWTTRRIVTFNDGLNADGSASTSSNGRQGVDFRSEDSSGTDTFSTAFSGRQQALLNTEPGSGIADGLGADRVDYLRGDNSNEGANGFGWRERVSTTSSTSTAFSIGDFISSSPLYVRYPTSAYIPPTDFTTFKTYATNVATRTPVLYVGGNDGMLHAFNASDNSDDGVTAAGATANSGKEIFAFVPSTIFSKLNQLTWKNYSHKYFVDGSPVVADVQLSSSNCDPSSDTNKCWRTLITGGLNAGGQGIYALDGTNPSNFSTVAANSLVLWEFTDRDDPHLGYTFSQPVVRKMHNGRWAVIFGNGYNNTTSDGSVSSTGRAYLYILYVDGPGFATGGRGNNWVLNTNYKRIELIAPNEGSTTPISPANGLSTVFPLDTDEDNLVDYLYAGDRYGNIWKIDVTSSNPADWGSAFGSTSTPLPLFTATTGDTTPVMQQITTSPLVAQNPYGGYIVLFGTGSFVDESDNTSPFSMNSFYGIWDKNDGTRVTSRAQLQKQAMIALDSTTTSGTTYSIQSNCQPQYDSTAQSASSSTTLCPSSLAPTPNGSGLIDQQMGWALDLKNKVTATSNTGERYMSSVLPVLDNGLLTFVTLTPSGDVCGGNSYDFIYNLDYMTGAAYGKPLYYTWSSTDSTPISASFTSGGTTTTVFPSGKGLTTSIGQNPKTIDFEADHGKSTPTTTGCHPFVKGRPCAKDKFRCMIVSITAGCESTIKAPATGRISWRRLFR